MKLHSACVNGHYNFWYYPKEKSYLEYSNLLLSFGLRLFEWIRFRSIIKLGKKIILDFSEKPVLLFIANCFNFFVFNNIAGYFH